MSDAVVSVVVASIAGVITASLLGSAQFGILAYASAALAIVLPVTTALDQQLIRDFSTPGRGDRASLAAPFMTVGGMALLGLFVVWALALARIHSPAAAWTTAVAGLTLLGAPFLASSTLLIAHGRSKSVSVTRSTGNVLGALARVTAALTLGTALAVQSVATLMALAIAIAMFVVAGGHRTLTQGLKQAGGPAKDLLSEGWPLVVSAIAISMYMSSDQIMLGLMRDDAETGEYAMAVRIVALAYIAPVVVMTAAAPAIARAKSIDADSYTQHLQRLASYLVALALLASVVLSILSFLLFAYILPEDFEPSYPLVLALLPGAIFVALGVAQGPWIINEGKQRFGMHKTLVGAALNVVLNLVLIPRFGAVGAAVSTVLAYGSTALVNWISPEGRGYIPVQARAFNPIATWHMARSDLRRALRRE